eukprot:TRINITY_DN2903_c0_g1_i1.p1 TRINITY_DN2903_c0_g1~~TRINITY_DN2903_c0_g1_i1.p1  ORF type:complete len:1006 (-),score=219.19 TRINITY_DN2903_c0_g1_i1:318-3335(-)
MSHFDDDDDLIAFRYVLQGIESKYFDSLPQSSFTRLAGSVREHLRYIEAMSHFDDDDDLIAFRYVLQGIESKYFDSLPQSSFTRLAGSVREHLRYIEAFITAYEMNNMKSGLILQSLAGALAAYLQYYRASVMSAGQSAHTVVKLMTNVRGICSQLHYLAELFGFGKPKGLLSFPRGAAALSYIYDQAESCAEAHVHLCRFLFKRAMQPYLVQLSEWIYKGQVQDRFGEFAIALAAPASQGDAWESTFGLHTSGLPNFLANLASELLQCGKCVDILHVHSPHHYLLRHRMRVMRLGFSVASISRQENARTMAEAWAAHKREQYLRKTAPAPPRSPVKRRVEPQVPQALQEYRARAEERLKRLREKLYEKYHTLSRQQEERLRRAEWRVKRLKLQQKRLIVITTSDGDDVEDDADLADYDLPDNNLAAGEAPAVAVAQDVVPTTAPPVVTETLPEPTQQQQQPVAEDRTTPTEPLQDTVQELTAEDVVVVVSPVLTENLAEPIADQPPVQGEPATPTQQLEEHATPSQPLQQSIDQDMVIVSPMVSPIVFAEQTVDESGTDQASAVEESTPAAQQPEQPVVDQVVASSPIVPAANVLVESVKDLSPVAVVVEQPTMPAQPLQQLAGQDVVTFSPVVVENLFTKQTAMEPIAADVAEEPATPAQQLQQSNTISQDVLDTHPLAVVVDRCIRQSILAQARISNTAAVDLFMRELQLSQHLQAIRRYILMDAGDFADVFCTTIFPQVGSAATRLPVHILNRALETALRVSSRADDKFASRVSVSHVSTPHVTEAELVNQLNYIQLNYKVEAPLDLIFTPECMKGYNRLFTFLFKMRRVNDALSEIWLVFNDLRAHAPRDPRMHTLHLFRHEMQHFVGIIQGFVITHVLDVRWRKLEQRLQGEVTGVDHLRQLHAEFLENVLKRSMLHAQGQLPMQALDRMLSIVLKLRAQITGAKLDDSMFKKVLQTRDLFTTCGRFLFMVLKKFSERVSEDDVADLVMRLNYNDWLPT